jgi:hypothetical protein
MFDRTRPTQNHQLEADEERDKQRHGPLTTFGLGPA